MRTQIHNTDRRQTRRGVTAGACQWHVSAVASRSGIAAMVGTLFTAKINPSKLPGGLPNEGEP